MPSYFLTATDLMARLSSEGYDARLDDNISALTNVQQKATNRVKLYCESEYNLTDLQTNADTGGWVNDIATDLGVYYLCARRGNTPPQVVQKQYEEAIGLLEQVRDGHVFIPGVAERESPKPVVSNLSYDMRYNFKRVRVEVPISTGTSPTGYTQIQDWRSVYTFEF